MSVFSKHALLICNFTKKNTFYVYCNQNLAKLVDTFLFYQNNDPLSDTAFESKQGHKILLKSKFKKFLSDF